MKSNILIITSIVVLGIFAAGNSFAATNIWGEVKKLTASDAKENHYFGRSVDISGDNVIVGAASSYDRTYFPGDAYIFNRDKDGSDTWGQLKKLAPIGGKIFPDFGVSVAIDGNVAVVGAPDEDSIIHNEGAAYVFECNEGGPTNWGQVQRLIITNLPSSSYFGHSVDVDQEIAIVGAYGENSIGSLVGAAYVFERETVSSNPWSEIKKLTAYDAEPDDRFGVSVAVAGDIAVVGASTKNAGSTNSAGAAYIFERPTNNWGEVKKLTVSNPELGDYFGSSVAADGDVVVVGAPGKDAGDSQNGIVYIFERNAGGANNWGEVKKLIPVYEYPARDGFGSSVAVAGNVVIVGAPATAQSSKLFSGVAYVFERNAGGSNNWGQVKKLVSDDLDREDRFGYSVAVDGDVAAIGAVYEKEGGTNAGAAYIFEGYDSPPPSDIFANADSLIGDTGIASGSNTYATTEPGEPAHAGNNGPYHSVWWNVSAQAGALLVESAAEDVLLVDTHGSDFDTVLAVYTGPAVSNLTLVAANDDAGPGIDTSEVSFQLISGENYHIAIDGKTASATGNIVLNYTAIPEPGCVVLVLCLAVCGWRIGAGARAYD